LSRCQGYYRCYACAVSPKEEAVETMGIQQRHATQGSTITHYSEQR
jgi:hypothetical protein